MQPESIVTRKPSSSQLHGVREFSASVPRPSPAAARRLMRFHFYYRSLRH